MPDRHAPQQSQHTHVLISCPDRRGVIANVTTAIANAGGNVLDADQHADPNTGRFSMRLVFEGDVDRPQLEQALSKLQLTHTIRWPGPHPKVTILCSKQTHCLADLLWRASINELPTQITRVISNHPDAQQLTESFGYTYTHLPISKDTKQQQEEQLAALLESDQTDLIILARYMQILSPTLIDQYPGRIINIHHSFLPAFAGAKPYHRAFERGVKIIGATAHYATADLDEGPIVAQGTTHVTHRDTVDDMIRKGRDLERVTLANAVRMHLENRVIIDNQRTIVFE